MVVVAQWWLHSGGGGTAVVASHLQKIHLRGVKRRAYFSNNILTPVGKRISTKLTAKLKVVPHNEQFNISSSGIYRLGRICMQASVMNKFEEMCHIWRLNETYIKYISFIET